MLKLRFTILLVILAATASAQTARRSNHGEAFDAISQSIKGMLFSTESDDNFKPFFVKPKKGESVEAALKRWMSHFPTKDRPDSDDVSEYGNQGFAGFIEAQVLMEIDAAKEADDGDRELANVPLPPKPEEPMLSKWKTLANLMHARLTEVKAWQIGSDEGFYILVLCGYDAQRNLVGCWAKGWDA